MSKASRLIKDLSNLPGIIGNLGLAVAGAQKAFNADYLENVLVYLNEAAKRSADGTSDAQLDAVKKILTEVGPSRYQFTQTDLSFRADLSQTFSAGGEATVGAGMGAISVNASMAVAFGYDYRAAAEVSTVLQAIPADRNVMASLLNQAEKLKPTAGELPERTDADEMIFDLLDKIRATVPADAD
jgi:hypothetical protein